MAIEQTCTRCEGSAPVTAQFCPTCGSPLPDQAQQSHLLLGTAAPAAPQAPRKRWIIPVAVLAALILLAAAGGTWFWLSNSAAPTLSRQQFDRLAGQPTIAGFKIEPMTSGINRFSPSGSTAQCQGVGDLEGATLDPTRNIFIGTGYGSVQDGQLIVLSRASSPSALAKLMSSLSSCYTSLGEIVTSGSTGIDGTGWWAITDTTNDNARSIFVATGNVLLYTQNDLALPGADIAKALKIDVNAIH
jgi:hypothetical protein